MECHVSVYRPCAERNRYLLYDTSRTMRAIAIAIEYGPVNRS
jgi:hypothetical protein